MTADWDTPVGARLTRTERKAKYGASIQGGILPSRETSNVFIYSEPEVGETFGYNFDGWSADGSTFLYTGAGTLGPQVMKRGNRTLLEHRAQGRALRLFVYDGIDPASGHKKHRYLGEFEVDKDYPYFVEEAPDREGELRTVFVFRLRPVGEALRRSEDTSGAGDMRDTSECALVAPELHNASTFERSATSAGTALRRESDLVARYSRYLLDLGHTIKRWQIQPAGSTRPLWTDIYDEATNELYEAKGSATRDAIRQAIGQLFDYRRHLPEGVKLSVLLPAQPNDDLIDLLSGLGMHCVYEESEGSFVRVSP
ncbi:hypothetical protein JOL79_30905 [Microbispora sp. RL4-1S]|uniref:ScoMcrA-like SRA domain-containing protein n=1 Tax=Microbispora oryzae TaxID=2806554 RepID=A0A940WRU6_9ACTN|nr:hypothetical protein [Microbispora oryzae]MBP2708198.1 hypothetical protein [Microbispora oryzae]